MMVTTTSVLGGRTALGGFGVLGIVRTGNGDGGLVPTTFEQHGLVAG